MAPRTQTITVAAQIRAIFVPVRESPGKISLKLTDLIDTRLTRSAAMTAAKRMKSTVLSAVRLLILIILVIMSPEKNTTPAAMNSKKSFESDGELPGTPRSGFSPKLNRPHITSTTIAQRMHPTMHRLVGYPLTLRVSAIYDDAKKAMIISIIRPETAFPDISTVAAENTALTSPKI